MVRLRQRELLSMKAPVTACGVKWRTDAGRNGPERRLTHQHGAAIAGFHADRQNSSDPDPSVSMQRCTAGGRFQLFFRGGLTETLTSPAMSRGGCSRSVSDRRQD